MKTLILIILFLPSICFADVYYLIKNGAVVNIVKADAAFVSKIASDYDKVIKRNPSHKADVKWLYDGSKFVKPADTPAETKRKNEDAANELARENKHTEMLALCNAAISESALCDYLIKGI